MDAAEYKQVVLSLIFLKYISDAFEEHHSTIRPGGIMELLIVRHGQSTGNVAGTVNTEVDVGLTPLGRRQASHVAARLKEIGVDVLYCSPMRRAIETTLAITKETGLQPHVLKTSHETSTPGMEEICARNLARYPQLVIETGMPDMPFAVAEGRPQAYERAIAVVSWLREAHEHSDRKVVVVNHGSFGDLLVNACLGMPLCDYTRFSSYNCCIHWIMIKDAQVKIRHLDIISHIPVAELT